MTMDLRVPGAAIAVAGVVLAITTQAHGSSRLPDPLLGVASTPQQANLHAQVMLDRAYQLGAVRLPKPASYTSLPFRQHEVEQTRWLSTVGSPTDIVARITAHPPKGFVVTSSSRLTRSTDEAYYGQTIQLKPYGQANSSLHVLDVTAFLTTAARSTVLLQATVGWVPPRTPVERIPRTPAGSCSVSPSARRRPRTRTSRSTRSRPSTSPAC